MFDLISLMNHRWLFAGHFSGLHHVYSSLQPPASIMQKKENEYSQMGGGWRGGGGGHCPWTTTACSVGVNFLSLNEAVMKFPRLITAYLPADMGFIPIQCC